MNTIAKLAISAAAVLVLGSMSPAFAADAAKGPQVSAESGKDLATAQKASNAQKYDEALASLDKVKANPKKTEYDEFVMNQFYYNVYIAQKKLDLAQTEVELLLSSQYMLPDDKKKFTVSAAYLGYQLKDYDRTIKYGTQAVNEGYAPLQLQTVVAQAYYLKEDFKNTSSYSHGVVDAQVKAGQTPPEDLLKLGESAAVKLKDNADLARWLDLMVGYYPNPEYWQDEMDLMYQAKMTDKQVLQLYRLISEVLGLKNGSDYAEMAQLAVDSGSPGEAVTTLNNGFTANVFTDPAEKKRNQLLLDSAKKQAAADQPTLAKTEADSASAASGDRLASVGIGYFGYGDLRQCHQGYLGGPRQGHGQGFNRRAPAAGYRPVEDR
ncbi:MAG: hypothetical protein WDM77_11055 [Steroidobacteraceae bacterium]